MVAMRNRMISIDLRDFSRQQAYLAHLNLCLAAQDCVTFWEYENPVYFTL